AAVVQWAAHLVREHPFFLRPRQWKSHSLLLLVSAVTFHLCQGDVIQDDRSMASRRLGRPGPRWGDGLGAFAGRGCSALGFRAAAVAPHWPGESAADGDRALVEIDIWPLQAERFGLTQPRGEGHEPTGAVAAVLAYLNQGSYLFGGQRLGHVLLRWWQSHIA